MEPKGPHWRAWWPALLWSAVILGLGSASFDKPSTSRFLAPLIQWFWPDLDAEQIDAAVYWVRKLAHTAEYGVLAILALRAGMLGHGLAIARSARVAFGVTLLVAGLDEGQQALSATRTGSARDALLDAASAGLFLLAAGLAERWRERPLFPLFPSVSSLPRAEPPDPSG